MSTQILVVDDDIDYLHVMRGKLSSAGYKMVTTEEDPRNVITMMEQGVEYDLALIDMSMPEVDGLALLGIIKNASPRTECIMVTAVNEARVAVDCLKNGAYDYLVKPISRDVLIFSIRRALERKFLLDLVDLGKRHRIPELRNKKAFSHIITRCSKMIRLLKEAELHAGSDVPILITGESGTGKELLARAIHLASRRAKAPFTPINMVSLSGNLFEAEFFGHRKGAFTGAERDRSGILKRTDQGTLFLDEIGTLALALQGKLLRVLQEGEFTRLGSSVSEKVDIRFIAATNEDIEGLKDQGKFRKDLYYRIMGGRIHFPPLRERKEDIPILANHFLEEVCKDDDFCKIDEDAMCLLLEYDYPGNVRELRSIVHAAVNLSQGRPITPAGLPEQMRKPKSLLTCGRKTESAEIMPLSELEKQHILSTYQRLKENKSQTAKALGIGLNTLRRKLKSYGVS